MSHHLIPYLQNEGTFLKGFHPFYSNPLRRSAYERMSDLPAKTWTDYGKCRVRRNLWNIDACDLYHHWQIGRLDSEKPAAIRLSGESIVEEHCYFENVDGRVTLHALPNAVTVSLTAFCTLWSISDLQHPVLERKTNHSWTSEHSQFVYCKLNSNDDPVGVQTAIRLPHHSW